MRKHVEIFVGLLTILNVLASLGCFGCSAVTSKVARDATPVAIDSGVDAGLSDRNQEAVVQAMEPERIERATEKLAAGATDGWTKAIVQDDRQERVADALSPVVASLVQDAVQAALRDEHLARVRLLAKQATLGFQDAIDEVAEKRESGAIPAEKGNVLGAVDNVAEQGGPTLYVLGAVAVVLSALLGAGLVWALSRKRRFETQAA